MNSYNLLICFMLFSLPIASFLMRFADLECPYIDGREGAQERDRKWKKRKKIGRGKYVENVHPRPRGDRRTSRHRLNLGRK